MTISSEHALEDLVEHLRTRFYGKYRGTVSEVDASTCRIKARVPAVLGAADSSWCMPCVPYAGPSVGFVFLPEPGSGVWIEFEGGDVSYPIWTGCFWRAGEVPANAAADVKMIVTAASLQLALDDGQGSISLSEPGGNEVTIDGSAVTLVDGAQNVVVSAQSVSVNNGALEVI